MTDPRLLVPLHLLPPVSGAPVAYMCGKCGAAWTVSSSCEHFGTVGALVECLDLSPPDMVDGVPVRLDALQWALDVIAVWYGLSDWIQADDIRLVRERGQRIWGAAWDAFGGAPVLWPDDPGYEPVDDDSNDQVRRIVAAILRKGRPGVTP